MITSTTTGRRLGYAARERNNMKTPNHARTNYLAIKNHLLSPVSRVLQPRDYLLAKTEDTHNHDPIEFVTENSNVVGYKFSLMYSAITQAEINANKFPKEPCEVIFLAEPLDNGEEKSLANHKRWCKTHANTRKARVPSLPEFLEAAYQANALQDVYPAARAFLENIQRLMPQARYGFDSIAKYKGERATITHTGGNATYTVEETIPTFNIDSIVLAREQHPGRIGINVENLNDTVHRALQALGGQYCTPANLQQLARVQRNVTFDESVYQDERATPNYANRMREHNSGEQQEQTNLAREARLWTPSLHSRAQLPERVLSLSVIDHECFDVDTDGGVNVYLFALGVVDAKNFP